MRYVFAFLLVLVAQIGYSATRNEVVISSLQTHEFTTVNLGWKKIVDVYYNPEYTPDALFSTSRYMVGVQSLKQEETRNQLMEIVIAGQISYLNAQESSFIGRYMGQTERDCQDLTDGVIVLCWGESSSNSHLGITKILMSVDDVTGARTPLESYIMLSSSGLALRPSRDIEYVVQHELLHLAGLGHSQYSDAIMYANMRDIDPVMTKDDKAGLRSLYPVGKDCIPVVETADGVSSFTAQVYFMGELIHGRFTYRSTGGYGSLEVTELLEPNKDFSCTKKISLPYFAWRVKFDTLVYTLAIVIEEGNINIKYASKW